MSHGALNTAAALAKAAAMKPSQAYVDGKSKLVGAEAACPGCVIRLAENISID